MTAIVNEQLPDSVPELTPEQKIIAEHRARFWNHQGYINKAKGLMKLQLDDDDILSGEWQPLTRAERRKILRMSAKQQRKGMKR